MNFIEISPNVCVNTKFIEWIASDRDGSGSIMRVGRKEYPSDIPYKTLVAILKSQKDNTMQKLDNYLSTATVHAV